MTSAAETTGVFNYQREQHSSTDETARLAAAAAVEPILKRWRHRCTDSLIDDTGKIRNVFTKAQRGARDNVSRVIEQPNQVPEALAEFAAALEARRQLYPPSSSY